MSEIIQPGETGFLVSGINEAVEALTEVDSIQRSECRDRAILRFSRERMVRDYLAVYARILSVQDFAQQLT